VAHRQRSPYRHPQTPIRLGPHSPRRARRGPGSGPGTASWPTTWLLPAVHGDDDGAAHGDAVKRTFRAVVVAVPGRGCRRGGRDRHVAPGRGRARAPLGPVLSGWAGVAVASG
jgi:hypothetical protein